jgi:hypothetical protein
LAGFGGLLKNHSGKKAETRAWEKSIGACFLSFIRIGHMTGSDKNGCF